jgi:ketosteroid isomerase-like protein
MKKSFMRLVSVFPLALLLCLAFSCQKKTELAEVKETTPVVNLEAEKAKVQNLLAQFVNAMKTKNFELYSKIWSHDSDLLVFGDGGEIFIGWGALESSAKKGIESIEEVDYTIKDPLIKVHESGEVGWASWLMDYRGKAQGQSFISEGGRFTMVAEKRNGNWLIVQWHGSKPLSGQPFKK